MHGGCRAFSIVDVLVSISVVAILISLLMPTLSGVRRSAHKIMCRSNVRQIGLGIQMYADDYTDALPVSIFVGVPGNPELRQTHRTTTLRIGDAPEEYAGQWDGLGTLYALDYLKTPQVFYCPAERGDAGWRESAYKWAGTREEIVGNYQYRGEGPNGTHYLDEIKPRSSALVTNALSSKIAYSHGDGSNVLRADLSVFWFSDLNGALLAKLADDPFANPDGVDDAWDAIDKQGPPIGN
jgi:type II secretory pathway pseudopilin PulG